MWKTKWKTKINNKNRFSNLQVNDCLCKHKQTLSLTPTLLLKLGSELSVITVTLDLCWMPEWKPERHTTLAELLQLCYWQQWKCTWWRSLSDSDTCSAEPGWSVSCLRARRCRWRSCRHHCSPRCKSGHFLSLVKLHKMSQLLQQEHQGYVKML